MTGEIFPDEDVELLRSPASQISLTELLKDIVKEKLHINEAMEENGLIFI